MPVSRTRWRIQVAYLLALSIAALYAGVIVARTTEEDRVRKAALRFEESWIRMDWERVRKQGTPAFRAWLESEPIEFVKGPGWPQPRGMGSPPLYLGRPSKLELFLVMPVLARDYRPIPDSALLLDDPREFLHAVLSDRSPETRFRFSAFKGDQAAVAFEEGWFSLCFGREAGLQLKRVGGTWRIDRFRHGWTYHPSVEKLPIRLPLLPVVPGEVSFVLDAGSECEGAIAALAGVLHARLRSAPGAVLLHVDPDLSWQEMVDLIDVAKRAGANKVLFTRPAPASRPEPGLRVNGVLVQNIEPHTVLPPAAAHPAMDRCMTICP